MDTTLRNASLSDLNELLTTQQALKHDVVLSARSIVARDGHLCIPGGQAVITDDGVTTVGADYLPTAVCDEHVAERLGIPIRYVRRMRVEATELWDQNVNHWLAVDGRRMLLRTFASTDPTQPGIARALLSEKFRVIDNLDVLLAALDGVRATGEAVTIDSVDISERKMSVKFSAPGIAELAPELLAGYRSPFAHGARRAGTSPDPGTVTDAGGNQLPIVHAGFVLSNSETGGGAFSLTPRLVVQVCTNGLTMKRDAVRSVHVGGKLDEGIVRYSDETQQRSVELVKSVTADAVRTFLDVAYMRRVLAEMNEHAGAAVAQPDATITVVANKLKFSDAEREGLLSHFILGGQLTAGGVMQAVTSLAQTVADPDRADEIEGFAFDALQFAASHAAL